MYIRFLAFIALVVLLLTPFLIRIAALITAFEIITNYYHVTIHNYYPFAFALLIYGFAVASTSKTVRALQ